MEEQARYVKCPFCAALCLYRGLEPTDHTCITNYTESQGLLACYSCGGTEREFSQAQRSLGWRARCRDCIASRRNLRYAPFAYMYNNECERTAYLDQMRLEHQLMHAVAKPDKAEVARLLAAGANPSYKRQAMVWGVDATRNNECLSWLYAYTADGSEIPDEEQFQPTTPLKMCVFRMPDCMLENEQRADLVEIARMLLQYEAMDAADAVALYEDRYPIPGVPTNHTDEYFADVDAYHRERTGLFESLYYLLKERT